MLRKIFGRRGRVERPLYDSTKDEANQRAHQILSSTATDGRSIYEVLSVLPAIRVQSPLKIRERDISSVYGSLIVRFGLMEPAIIQKRGFDIIVSERSTLGLSPVLGIFSDRVPKYIEILSHDLLDQADASVVGWDLVRSRPRKYSIELEPRVRAILKLLE